MIWKRKNKQEKNTEIDLRYVKEMYDYFNEVVPEMKNIFVNSELHSATTIDDVIKSVEIHLANLDVPVKFVGFDHIEAFAYNLPAIYSWEELENGHVEVYLSDFAKSRLEITICELVLFLMNCYVEYIGKIGFSEEQYENEEEILRPIMVFAAIYFGFGNLLLKFYFVPARIDSDYQYFVPLKLDFMVMMFLFVNENNAIDFSELPELVRSKLVEFENKVHSLFE